MGGGTPRQPQAATIWEVEGSPSPANATSQLWTIWQASCASFTVGTPIPLEYGTTRFRLIDIRPRTGTTSTTYQHAPDNVIMPRAPSI
ncbi:predicted protein [Plenodomus lingam JN3]|uniref:Predicted protein n=1 Tax=Leptosphaeria maculans (strain JN3 / isolate v23.1.3 / race Av1-4-5-6-7-8) TaxID=985895 RepID=E5AET2_LEPMJ|nr:predicted protein [Plenodomus lingam JN3]CBY01721.1 predicted protein [Plenodomus lingam JN3]